MVLKLIIPVFLSRLYVKTLTRLSLNYHVIKYLAQAAHRVKVLIVGHFTHLHLFLFSCMLYFKVPKREDRFRLSIMCEKEWEKVAYSVVTAVRRDREAVEAWVRCRSGRKWKVWLLSLRT